MSATEARKRVNPGTRVRVLSRRYQCYVGDDGNVAGGRSIKTLDTFVVRFTQLNCVRKRQSGVRSHDLGVGQSSGIPFDITHPLTHIFTLHSEDRCPVSSTVVELSQIHCQTLPHDLDFRRCRSIIEVDGLWFR